MLMMPARVWQSYMWSACRVHVPVLTNAWSIAARMALTSIWVCMRLCWELMVSNRAERPCSAIGIQQQWASRIESLLCVPVSTGVWALQLNLQEVQECGARFKSRWRWIFSSLQIVNQFYLMTGVHVWKVSGLTCQLSWHKNIQLAYFLE